MSEIEVTIYHISVGQSKHQAARANEEYEFDKWPLQMAV
jgi:hypothetical protein